MKERKEKNVSYLSEEVSTPAAPLGVSYAETFHTQTPTHPLQLPPTHRPVQG